MLRTGQSFVGTVVMQNTGTDPWTYPGVKLGAKDDSDPFRPGLEPRVWLVPGQVVPPGATATFQFTGVAGRAGIHRTDWQMVREGVRWFGGTAQRLVVVFPGAATSSPDDARLVSIDFPRALTTGQRATGRVTMQNRGTSVWEWPHVKLGAVGDQDPLRANMDVRVWLPQGTRVAPGQSFTFDVELLAPGQPGDLVSDWRMVREGVRWFGDTGTTRVRVDAPVSGNQAVVDAVDFPATLVAGQRGRGRVTMRNTGTSTWIGDMRLGANDDDDPFRSRLGPRVYLPQGTTVAPGQSHTFECELEAPLQTGRFLSDWRMVHEGVEWFGQVAVAFVDVTPAPPRPRRSGIVRLQGRSVADDQGPFPGLGATLFWGAWAWKNDRQKLERNLDYLSRSGFDYVRCLGVVGDPARADYWDGREIEWRWPDYRQVIEGLTDLAFDTYGLRVEWTLIGDGQVSIPDRADRYRLADLFIDMARGREQKIMHFEVANEAWQNGFSGQQGVDELRALSRYMKDRTDILVAASAPPNTDPVEVEGLYNGQIADLATIHFDRRNDLVDGGWRPVRQPWEHQFLRDVPPGSNNEPIGPGSSVTTERDPMRIVAGSIATHVAGLPLHVFHSGAGVRGLPQDGELWDMPGTAQFIGRRSFLPGDLSSWTPKNGHWADAPFRPFARDAQGREHADSMWPDHGNGATGAVRCYGAVRGNDFFVFPFGIQGRLTLEARRAMELEVIDVFTGQVLERRQLAAGQRFDLQGATAFVIKGRFV